MDTSGEVWLFSVKATAQQDDEREHIRREKMAIEGIRAMLAEMLEDDG